MIFFLICFLASAVGAVCGIGGGVIIKPVLDAFGILDVETISFLSGCTVLSMTAYAVLKSRAGGNAKGDKKVRFPMAAGAALGGLAGKELFSFAASLSPDRNRVGAVQAFCLLLELQLVRDYRGHYLQSQPRCAWHHYGNTRGQGLRKRT